LNHYGDPHCNAHYYGSDSQSGTDTYKNEQEMGHIASDERLWAPFGLGTGTKVQGGRDQTDALLKGFTIAMP
jgi:hypothetical protein